MKPSRVRSAVSVSVVAAAGLLLTACSNPISTSADDNAAMASLSVFAKMTQSSYSPTQSEGLESVLVATAGEVSAFEGASGTKLVSEAAEAPPAGAAATEGVVSYYMGEYEGQEAFGLATRSKGGNCVAALGTDTRVVGTWSTGEDMGPACVGSIAFFLAEQGAPSS